jgi:asparagine N-glycosylation enzyme membrane subunit Stt3
VPALRGRRVRYVVVDADGRWLGREVGRASLLRALYEGDGADAASAPALAHMRLVLETHGAVFTRDSAPARYKVFERVVGAQVVGQAPPGAVIEATVDVSTSRGRAFAFLTLAVADEKGAYRLRLPYATRRAPSGVRVAAQYRLRCGASEAALAVDAAAVQQGLVLSGPAPCAAPLTPPHATTDETGRPQER